MHAVHRLLQGTGSHARQDQSDSKRRMSRILNMCGDATPDLGNVLESSGSSVAARRACANIADLTSLMACARYVHTAACATDAAASMPLT